MTLPPPSISARLPRSPAYVRFRRRLLTGVFSLVVLGIGVIASQMHAAYFEREQGFGLGVLLILLLAACHFALRSYSKLEERELRYRQLYATSRETEEKLHVSEQRLRLVTDNLPVQIAYICTDQRYRFTNRVFNKIYEVDNAAGKTVAEIIGAEGYAQSRDHLKLSLAGENVYFERSFRNKQGERTEGVTYIPDRDEDGKVEGLFLMVEDITLRKKGEESMKLAALMYENSTEGMMVMDITGVILSVNPAFSGISGYLEHEVVGRQAYELTTEGKKPRVLNRIRHAIYHTGEWAGEIWHRHKSGDHYLVSLRFNTVFDENGKAYRLVALFSDITKKKASEELIWRQANFDALTGLPNRRMFHERLQLEMKKTERSQLPMALVFIDLDHFKEINDTLGHDNGDILLKEVAVRLLHCVRSTDIVSRLGGDEFTVILSELKNAGDVARIAQQILKKMAEPFVLNQEIAQISSSIGITLYPDDGVDADTLLKNADQAMYAAKQQGRNRFNYFAPFMQEATRVRMALSNELRDAVHRDELRILFQPIVDLSTGKISKAEALVRWQHPVRGLLSPSDFIAIAENSGMIVSIGDWVFQQAALQAKRMQQLGFEDFQICVNKSAWQFRDDGSNYQQWLDLLDELDMQPNSIVIEITENLLLDPTHAVKEKILAFQHAHMQVSLDDFGTGYCSVAFLKRFNIDYIKIDPTFVSNLAGGADGITLCSAIVAMAHKLGIKVIAEGIETRQQMAALRLVGCDFGQGYFFSRPVLGPELEKTMFWELATVDN